MPLATLFTWSVYIIGPKVIPKAVLEFMDSFFTVL
jgi:hypothetical protein